MLWSSHAELNFACGSHHIVRPGLAGAIPTESFLPTFSFSDTEKLGGSKTNTTHFRPGEAHSCEDRQLMYNYITNSGSSGCGQKLSRQEDALGKRRGHELSGTQ